MKLVGRRRGRERRRDPVLCDGRTAMLAHLAVEQVTRTLRARTLRQKR